MEKYYNSEKYWWKKEHSVMTNENVAFYCNYMHFWRKLSACVTLKISIHAI